MCLNGPADLCPLDHLLVCIANSPVQGQSLGIGKFNLLHTRGTVNPGQGIALVQLPPPGQLEQIRSLPDIFGLAGDTSVLTLYIQLDPRSKSTLLGDGQQSDIGPVEAARLMVGGYADLLDQAHLAGVYRSQPVEQIHFFPMSSGVAEHAQRVERGNGVLGLLGAVYALGLINNDNRVCALNVSNCRLAIEPVVLLINHILRFPESVNVDNHDLDIAADRKLSYIGQLRGVVDEVAAGWIVIEGGKVLLCDLQGLIYTLPNGDGRHNDNKFGKTILSVQLKNRLSVNKGLSRPGLHLNGKLIPCQSICLG